MGGPWFVVHKSGGDWQRVDSLWLSDGAKDAKATLEMRVGFEDPREKHAK